jgi:hypothetical protein
VEADPLWNDEDVAGWDWPAFEVFQCVAGCGVLQRLVTIKEDGVRHGLPGHHTGYTLIAVLWCPVCGAGQFDWFDHDCAGYPHSNAYPEGLWSLPLAPAEVDRLRDALAECPDPLDGRCDCEAHRALRSSLSPLRREGPAASVAIEIDDGLPYLRGVPR